MGPGPALAVVDFADIPTGVTATDALVKASPIAWMRSGTVSRGRFLTLLGGSPAAVEVALERCLASAGNRVLDHVLLAHAHEQLVAGLRGARQGTAEGAVAILETGTASATVLAAERALKTAPVRLLEIRIAEDELDGKALAVYQGELPDLEAAMESAQRELTSRGAAWRLEVIPAPHEALLQQLGGGTRFAAAVAVDLPGESS
jgi:microcompartment protein CcmL/EutN